MPSKIRMTKIGSKNFIGTQAQERIQNELAKIFGEGTCEIVSFNIEELRKKLNLIIDKVQLQAYKSGTETRYKIRNNTDNKLELMAQAYLLLFQIREFLTGEGINYRYYYTTSAGEARVIEFQEKDLMEYIKFGKNALEISEGRIKKQGQNNEKYQALLDKHYQNLYQGIQDSTTAGRKVVHSYIMHKYDGINPGLRNKEDPTKYQLFTMGHFFEAVDISITEAIEQNQIDNYSFIENAVYGKHLYYDNIEGLRGGDNSITMTQIKSNAASILKYYTILESLKELRDIINVQNINKAEIKERVKELFLHETKYQDIQAFERAANQAAEKLVKLLEIG